MQPKFTQRNLWYSCAKMVTLSLFLAIFSQMTFAQNLPGAKTKHIEKTRTLEQVKARLKNSNAVSATSAGPAPVQNRAITNNGVIQPNLPGNPLSRAFCYDGGGPFQLNKQSLLNTTLTPIGAATPFGFPGASAWVTTTNTLYVVDQVSPFGLYTVDTTTGVKTFIANCTAVPLTGGLTGMTWDISTNTMYGVAINPTGTASQIFTINIATGVCTPIGASSAVSPLPIMLNAAPGGSLFSVDIVTDNLYRWNKTTGVATLIGSVGIDANFGQDGHFDLSDGQYYWTAFNNTLFQAQLRIIDTTNGSSTLVGTYTTLQVQTLGIYSIPLVPCSGVPDPGSTLSTINPVCPGINFTLYLSNSLSGMTYQWQSAPGVGGPWTNIGGATGSSYTTNIVTATAYRCNVICTASGQPGTSAPLLENVNLPSACYCDAGAIDAFDEKISRVRYNTIDNPSSSTGGYENFTAISTDVIQGSTQNITVDISTFFGGDQVRVWIDFNKNGNFSDPGERVVATVASTNPAVASITIPLTSSLGSTRMRVRMYWEPADPDPSPCGDTFYGQVEDYSVNIVPCIQGVFNSQPANQSIQCGNNATFSYTATGSLLTYGWEYRVNASSPWLNVPALPPYSGTTTNTLTITNVPVTMSGYQYRALISGPCTAVDFSNVVTLTVTPVVPIVTVIPASPICTGTVVKLTLTNVLAPVSTVLFNEDFAVVSPLPAGWASQNLSNPLGTTGWFQGNSAVFPSQNGAPTAYIAANYQNTGALGQISNWLFTPNVATIKNGDVFTFWSRKVAPDAFPDRLQVRMSLNGASTNVGATDLSVGDFTTLLVDINPTEVTGVYPIVWTLYTVTISGVPVPTSGRLAFRYFISNAGSAAPNGDYIGIDNVVYTSVTGGVAAGIWTSAPLTPNSMFTDLGATIAYTGVPANTIYVKPLAPLTSTNYSVSFTTPTPCTSTTLVVPINVSSPVSITTPPADRVVCVGSNTSFTVVSGGTPLTYQWEVSVNNGLTWTNVSGGTSATLPLNGVTQLMNNNLYRVTVTAAPCGSTTTAAGRLTVNQLPTVTISSTTLQLVPGRIATITASSSPAASAVPPAPWSWTLNGSTIAGASTNSVTANIDQQGTYQATVRDVNGCVNSSNTLTIGSEPSDNLWIYPNPNRGQFQVRLYYSGTQAERRIVRIYNMLGAVVGEKSFDFDSNTSPYARLDFDLSNLSAATYIVKVVDKNGNTIHSGKVVVQ